MKKLLLVESCDWRHSHADRVRLGVATSVAAAIQVINKHLDPERLTAEAEDQLRSMKQTQTDSDSEPPYEGEFILEEEDLVDFVPQSTSF